jgi:hypothetical protein
MTLACRILSVNASRIAGIGMKISNAGFKMNGGNGCSWRVEALPELFMIYRENLFF